MSKTLWMALQVSWLHKPHGHMNGHATLDGDGFTLVQKMSACWHSLGHMLEQIRARTGT